MEADPEDVGIGAQHFLHALLQLLALSCLCDHFLGSKVMPLVPKPALAKLSKAPCQAAAQPKLGLIFHPPAY